MSEKFNKEAILETIANYADDANTLTELQNYAFDYEPWIISGYKSVKALEQFDEEDQMYKLTQFNGVFGAIQYVKDFEKNEFGGVYIKLSDPEQLADMVAYINGYQILSELAEKLNLNFDDELTKDQVEQLSSIEAMLDLLN